MKSLKKLIFIVISILLILPGQRALSATVEELIKALHSRDQQKQFAAAEELGKMGNSEAVDALLNFVHETMEDWRVKIRAIRLLGEIDDPAVSDKLVTIFNDPFLNQECPAIKTNTALALGKRFNEGSRAVDSLIDALTYNDILVREAAIQSLGIIGDSRSVPFLMPLLNDKSFAIKMSTIKALERIGHPDAIPVLRKIADREKDPYIKQATLSALKNFRHD